MSVKTSITATDVWYTQQQKTLDEIAEKLGVVAYRPSYHGAERDKNTVLFYLKEDEEHNREVDRQPVRYSRSEAKDRGVNVNSECVYPDKECEIYWEPQIRDEEDGKPVYGLTDFADDGSVAVFVKPSLEVADAVEVLAHELAHVAVGVEHDHDEVWQEAFDKIFEEYNRIGNQKFPNGEQCVMDDPDEK